MQSITIIRTLFILGFSFTYLQVSETIAQQPRATTNTIGMKLMLIPKGSFRMGAPVDEPGRQDGERQHQVTISHDFYLAATEVTQGQYEKVMGTNPAEFRGNKIKGDTTNHPVENITWEEAAEFCRRLSEHPQEKAAGWLYQLPTEAEWEYACRAGSKKAFCFGDDPATLQEYAWHEGVATEKTHPVGLKKPNAWGLFDMHGNVWEWCFDVYEDYPKESVTDPRISDDNKNRFRVNRGGSWWTAPDGCRSAARSAYSPSSGSDVVGFRPAAIMTYRKWKTADGRFSTEAKYISFTGGKVTLEKHNGKQIVVDVSILSNESQTYIEGMLKQPRQSEGPDVPRSATTQRSDFEAEQEPSIAIQDGDAIINSLGMKLIWSSRGISSEERFYMGATEVTQAQYQKVMGTNPSDHQGDRIKGDSSNHPVERVSWDNAEEFCRRLTDLPAERAAGRVYRLPMSPEWEWACRAGSGNSYSFGDNPDDLGEFAWYRMNSGMTTQEVGKKRPNAWGFFDMHGNVAELCSVPPKGEMGWAKKFRGGSFVSDSKSCRLGDENKMPFLLPDMKMDYVGFRVVAQIKMESN